MREGNKGMKALLGRKGTNADEMVAISLSVSPAKITIHVQCELAELGPLSGIGCDRC